MHACIMHAYECMHACMYVFYSKTHVNRNLSLTFKPFIGLKVIQTTSTERDSGRIEDPFHSFDQI